tara:strand:- start:302478 stop:304793 length:2316 start_codon:yes stop_codon:yes gene_type:complete
MNRTIKNTQEIPNVTDSLGKKFSKLVLLAAFILGVISCLCYFYYTYSIYKKTLYDVIQQEIISSSQSATLAAYTVDSTMAEHLLDGIVNTPEIAHAQIILEDGVLLSQAGDPPQEYYFVTRMLFPNLDSFYEHLNFKIDDMEFETGELIIHPDYDHYTREIFVQLRISLLYISLLSLLLFIIIRKMISRELSSPIIALSQRLAAIKNDPNPIYQHRLIKPAKHNDDEIGYLIDNFNSLLENLKNTETMASNIKDTLATTEIQYTAMVKNTFEMFIRLDEKARVQFCNPAVKDILQFSLGEIIGTNLVSYIDNADKELFQSLFSDVVTGRVENTTLILHFATKSNEERILSCTITNALTVDKLQCILFVAHDITKSHHTENELRQSQKIESIGKLTGGIAHDFNNILTIIINNIELAQSKLKKYNVPNIEPVNDYLESALNASFGGADLTNRLLAFARNQPLNPLIFNPNDQIRNILPLLQRAISNNITITDGLAQNIGRIRIDKSQFDNAILNLCINSRDAMAPQRQGGIHITTTRVNIIPMPDGTLRQTSEDYIRIDIKDNGEGINPKNLKKVIDPFFTTKPMGKGTGLGLSMVHGFVHQSKGHFNIESKEGLGTTIQLYFPAYGDINYDKSEGNPLQPCEDEEELNGTGLTILILEDNVTIADIIEKLLQDMNFTVIKTHKTADAFAAFESKTIDLTLSDVLLPDDINGFAFADKIKNQYPDAKIVHMSGYTDPENLLSDTQYSIALRKPFRKRDLVQIIKEVLHDKNL